MIRTTILILFFLLTGFSLEAQSLVDTPIITTSLSMNMADEVDSIAELTLDVKVLEVGSALQVSSDTGVKVITVPDTSMSILEERAWKFDKKGRLVSWFLRSTDNRKKELQPSESVITRYDGDRIAEVLSYKEGELEDSTVYQYRFGHITKLEHYNGKGKYTGRKQYFLNRDNNYLSTISNKNEGLVLIDMTKYWYDAKGELLETTFHDNFQRLVLTRKFEYGTDSAGRKHTKIFDFAKPDTCTGMTSYLQDMMGNHLEDVVQDDRGMVLSYSTAKYNDYNHCVSRTVFTTTKVEEQITYEYDEHKNWTMKRIYRNGEPYRFVRRSIFYRN